MKQGSLMSKGKDGKPLKCISLSDIHLVHRNTPTRHICENIETYAMTEENKDADFFIIAGDLFERSFEAGTEELRIFLIFIDKLLVYCYENGIRLRILEGTPRHDCEQPMMIPKLNNIRENKVDLGYFHQLDIEYVPELDVSILYIPDEWCNDHDVLERQIQEKLLEKGLTHVDLGVFHGVFEFQVLGIPYNGFKFKESYFLSLVTGFIFIGHYHSHMSFDHILGMGSFDRLNHGQEEDKGYIVTIGNTWGFKKNENAFTYKTLKLTKRDTVIELDKKIEGLPVGSHVRLAMAKDHPLNIDFSSLIVKYIDYRLTKKMDKDSEKSLSHLLNDTTFNLTTFDFLNKNLKDIVIDRLKESHTLSNNQLSKLDGFLELFQGAENKEVILD